MPKKVWSISTTVRNPERMINFLKIAKIMEGTKWDKNAQAEFQTRLIQNRFYGFDNNQFTNNLSDHNISILNDTQHDISYEEAKAIFLECNYQDPSMRGRTSFAPLKQFGFCFLKDDLITITESGKQLLKEDYNLLNDIFLLPFVSWQYPNPIDKKMFKSEDGYDIKPFIATIHLIRKVNEICKQNNYNIKGISTTEFSIFALSLINYNDIDKWANELIKFRLHMESLKTQQDKSQYKESFIKEFLFAYTNSKHIKDYTDNAIRYFRMTKIFYIRGGGFYIDLEPRRQQEIDLILEKIDIKANMDLNLEEYTTLISDKSKTLDLFKSNDLLLNRISILINENSKLKKDLNLNISDYKNLYNGNLENNISELELENKELHILKNKHKYSSLENIDVIIDKLKNIKSDLELKPSIALEKWITMALNVINDAKSIIPNYPVGDDNEPTFTASGNKPDIECYYDSFNAICEVTLLNSRNQWYNEGQPVMRHLRDFEVKQTNNLENYCVFVAMNNHRDTINTFWTSNKYEYEGKPQKIIPITINNIIYLLEILKYCKTKNIKFKHNNLKALYDKIYNSVSTTDKSETWINGINSTIKEWSKEEFNYS